MLTYSMGIVRPARQQAPALAPAQMRLQHSHGPWTVLAYTSGAGSQVEPQDLHTIAGNQGEKDSWANTQGLGYSNGQVLVW